MLSINKKVIEKDIVDYFDICEIHYKRFWDLKNSMAIHFGFWDENTTNFAQALQNENKLLAETAHINKSDVVLDAGCGVGGSSIFLAREYACKVTGITLSEKQVLTAKQNAQKFNVENYVDFFKKDFSNTDLPDKSFTVIWAIESMCYAPDKKVFLAESMRLLADKAKIIIADGFLKDENLTHAEINKMKWLDAWSIPNFYTINEFKKLLEDTGFKHITFMNMTSQVLPSSKRAYIPSLIMYPAAKLMEWTHLRKKIQTDHVIGSIYQYLTLKKKIWMYGIFYAEKKGSRL